MSNHMKFLLPLLAAASLMAQSASETAELSGTVTDPTGAVIGDARIVLRNEQTGFERLTRTSPEGAYRFVLVPPGLYEVRVEKENFSTKLVNEVRLTIGQGAVLNIQLELGQATQVLEISGDVSLIESERTNQGNTLQQEFVKNLPIDRRDYLSFTLLAPGVVDAAAMADNTDYRVVQTPTSGLSFYGSNGRGNSVTVDGGEANDAAGGVRPNLSQEAVEEFQVNRSNYTAELGGASGGVINIVSKSGGNNVRGSLFGFFRHQSLDAGDPFARVLDGAALKRVKPSADRQQFGGSIGGPIAKDRSFFFFAYEGLNRDESNVVSVLTDRSIFGPTREQEAILGQLPAAAAGALRAALTAPASTVQLFENNSGITPFTSNSNKFSLRLDHNASASNQLFFRFGYAKGDDSNSTTRALVGSSRGYRQDTFDATGLGGWTHTAGPGLVNDLRLQWSYFTLDSSTPRERFGPEFNIAGFGFFNRDIFLPAFSINRRGEIRDTVAKFHGNHSVKFGGQVNIRNNHDDTQTFVGGRFNFGPLPAGLVNPALASTTITGLQAFNLGLPQAFQIAFGDTVVRSTYPFYGFFLQDSWKVRKNLLLDLGMRYELDTRKKPVPTDKNNFAPRFGFAWDPAGDGKTSVRGGYGIFYSPIYFQIDWVVNALGIVDGRRQIAQALTTIQTAGPAAANNIYTTLRRQGVIGVPTPTRALTPGDLSQFGLSFATTGALPPLSVIFENSGDYRNSYSQQATLSVERQIAPSTSISVAGIFSRTLKITRARDSNLGPAPVNPQLGIKVWRTQDFVNPLLYQRNVYESTANADYRGFILELKKRFSSKFSMAGNYTLSRARDEVTDFNSDFQANDQTNLAAERALSSFHQRHKFVLYGVWQTPGNFQLAPIFRANSGRPFNLLVGSDINADRHSTTDRPPGAGRNTGRGPAFFTFDMRVSKRIQLGSNERRVLELLAEGFNLTNRLNYSSVNNTVGMLTGSFDVTGRHDRGASDPLGFTSAFDPRRIQLGARVTF